LRYLPLVRQGLHHFCAEGPRITAGRQLDGTFRRRDRDGVAVGAFCMIGALPNAPWSIRPQSS